MHYIKGFFQPNLNIELFEAAFFEKKNKNNNKIKYAMKTIYILQL